MDISNDLNSNISYILIGHLLNITIVKNMVKMLEYQKNKGFDKNPINDKTKNINQSQDFESLTIPIKIPKIILTATDIIIILTNLPRDELYNQFIANELGSFCFDLDALFRFILKRSGLSERLRVGINQHYGKEYYKKKEKCKRDKNFNKLFEIIDITIELPKKLMDFVNTICEISEIQKENLFSFLIIARLEYIYQENEILLGYVNDEVGIYKDLREGVNLYYETEKIQKKIT